MSVKGSSNFDVLEHSSTKSLNPDEGNVSACLFKSVDWACAKALGSKRDKSVLPEEDSSKTGGKGLDSIKGKDPSSKDLINMHAALGKDIYGGQHSPHAVAAADALINGAIKGEHPEAATKRAHDAQASHGAEEARHHEQHGAARHHEQHANPHTQPAQHTHRRTA